MGCSSWLASADGWQKDRSRSKAVRFATLKQAAIIIHIRKIDAQVLMSASLQSLNCTNHSSKPTMDIDKLFKASKKACLFNILTSDDGSVGPQITDGREQKANARSANTGAAEANESRG